MNPNTPQPSRAEIEIRLTALLLGELPSTEAELLRWSISQDAELAKLHDRLRSTMGLVREVAANPDDATTKPGAPLKMSEERRQKLLAHFKTVAPREFMPVPVKEPRKMKWLVPLAAVLVVSAMLAALLLPALSAAKRRAMNVASLSAPYDSVDQGILGYKKSINQSPRGMYGKSASPSADVEVLVTNAMAPAATGMDFADATLAVNKPESQPAPKTPIFLPGTSPSLDTWAQSPIRQSLAIGGTFVAGSLNGVGGGGGGGFGGNADKPALSWGVDNSSDSSLGINATPTPAVREGFSLMGPQVSPANSISDYRESGKDNSVAENSALPGGGVYSQSIVGFVNSLGGTTVAQRPTIPAGTVSDFTARFQFQTSSAETSKVPAAGESRVVAKESKDDTFSLADTLKSSHTIVLPPDSGGYAGAVGGDGTVAANTAGQNFQWNARNRAGGPAAVTYNTDGTLADSFKNSGQIGNAIQGAQAQDSIQQSEKLFYRNPVVTAVPRNQESVPLQYAQSANVAEASRESVRRQQQILMPALPSAPPVEAPVALDVPPPSSAAIPPPPSGAVIVATTALSAASTPASEANPIGAFPSSAPVAEPPAPPDDSQKDDRALQPAPSDVPVPQPEVATKDNAFSTFSLNVSDVSFKLAAASLEHNVYPQPGSIRSEEFINAFDYRDPEPPAGAPVGFAWERAGDPFAHNRDFLRFSIKTAAEGRAPGRPLNLVLLLDKSGSMERADRVAIIQQALRVLAAQLGPNDTLSVITFARTARLYVDGVPGNQAGEVFGKLSGITPQGGTNLEEAMNLAYQTALRHFLEGGVNRVVLMTDGAANLGNVDPQHFKQKAEANRKQGIALDCFGIGWEDYNDNLLELLASHGDGRYGFLNTPEEASSDFATQLAGALKVAAADVKVQVEFNPARVIAYRQIGYATHQLTKQQFRDNTVDAAVIGAAESGNALYTVQINPRGDGPVATVRVRFRKPGTSEVQEHSWLVPYTGTAVALDQASPAMRLAATAGTFAEWLLGSPDTEDLNLDQLLDYLKGVPEIYGTDPRPKQLEWMIRQAKNFAGKG